VSKDPVLEGHGPVKKRYGVGLLGAGTVGGGLIRLVHEKLSHHRLPLEIQRVGVRNLSKSRSFNLPASFLSDDLESIVEDKSIDILVEAMGGLEPARTYIEKALESGKHVVTANKYVVSECGDYLEQLAKSHGRQFLFEASVAGSIAITLRSSGKG
jgi:homoserine dehydrogenase